MVVWDREDYLAEGYKQLIDESTYVEVKNFNDKTLSDLIEKNNNFRKRLRQETGHFRKIIPTAKVSKVLDHHLRPVMKSGKAYVKDTGDFLEKN